MERSSDMEAEIHTSSCRHHRTSSSWSKFTGLAVSGLGTTAVFVIMALDFGMWPKSNLYNYFVVGMTSLFGLFLRAVDCIDSIGTFFKVYVL